MISGMKVISLCTVIYTQEQVSEILLFHSVSFILFHFTSFPGLPKMLKSTALMSNQKT